MKSYTFRNAILFLFLILLVYFFFHINDEYSKNLETFEELKKKIFSGQPAGLDADGKPLIGRTFLNFKLEDINGGKWELYKIKAKIKIVIFFGVFDCSKCLLEYRLWNDIYSRYPEEEVFIFGVGYAPNKNAIFNFVNDKQIKFPVLFDPQNFVKKKMGIVSSPLRISINNRNQVIDIVKPNDSIENYTNTFDRIDLWLSSSASLNGEKNREEGLDSIKYKNLKEEI